MRLMKFRARGVHGYLDFDVPLDLDLVLLTGINGSGKTTVLNAIGALISPDLRELQTLEFKSLDLNILDDNNKKRTISAKQDNDFVIISVTGAHGEFQYNRFVRSTTVPPYRAEEDETEHYRELLAISFDHPVIAAIAQLPTPMFLGLDRRPRLEEHTRKRLPRSAGIGQRNVFGGPINSSLMAARQFAEEAYRRARSQTNVAGDELQRRMILDLLTFTEEDFFRIQGPTRDEKLEVSRAIRDVAEFQSISKLPADQVRARIDPFLERLQPLVESLPTGLKLGGRQDLDDATLQNLIIWSANKHHLSKLKVISQYVSGFNKRQLESMRPFNKYRELIDKFLKDSGKSLIADDVEGLSIKIEGVKDKKKLTSLSSGEAQIFVMLTTLAFHPDAQNANVFIIDEPELSLHIRWQEIFVESLMGANNKIQFVMATHSPSIIMDRIDACVEVAPKSRRR